MLLQLLLFVLDLKMMGVDKNTKMLFFISCMISLSSEGAYSMTTDNSSSTLESLMSDEPFGRTERSHEGNGPDQIFVEPRGRPMDTPENPDDPHFHPYFDDDTDTNVTYQLGKTAHLHCRIRQLGNRVVSWVRQKDLHILTVGTYTYTTDQRFTSIHKDTTDDWTLEVRELRKLDAGIYECQVSNEPKLSLGINLNVIVVEARIAEGPSLYVKSGGPVNLTCLVTDIVGTVFVFWYHDGNVIDDVKKSSGIRISTEIGPTTVSRLYIPAARPSDSGNYTCSPSYSEAATITLQVLIDEKPAAMQHGPNKGQHHVSSSDVIILLVLSLILLF